MKSHEHSSIQLNYSSITDLSVKTGVSGMKPLLVTIPAEPAAKAPPTPAALRILLLLILLLLLLPLLLLAAIAGWPVGSAAPALAAEPPLLLLGVPLLLPLPPPGCCWLTDLYTLSACATMEAGSLALAGSSSVLLSLASWPKACRARHRDTPAHKLSHSSKVPHNDPCKHAVL